MSTQRITLLKIAGSTGLAIADHCRALSQQFFQNPMQTETRTQIEALAERLYEHRTELPTLYYAEWIDRWLMPTTIMGPFEYRGTVALPGHDRFQIACLTRTPELLNLPTTDWPATEMNWLSARLHEAVAAWPDVTNFVLILIVESLGPSTTREAIEETLGHIPEWVEPMVAETAALPALA